MYDDDMSQLNDYQEKKIDKDVHEFLINCCISSQKYLDIMPAECKIISEKSNNLEKLSLKD